MKKRPAVPHFIEEEREKGSSDQEIRHKLLDAGWHMDIIHNALDPKHKKSSAKESVKKVDAKPGFLETSGIYLTQPVAILGIILTLLILIALFI